MEKKLARRKSLRRKYKRYAAVLAGAAIMAGTSLHGGIPFAKASAAENPSISPPVTTEQTTLANKDVKKPLIETEDSIPDPSVSQDQPDTNKDERHDVRDRGNREDRGDRGDRGDRRDEHRYGHERWFDRGETFAHRMQWYNDSLNKIQIFNNNANAVDIVMAAAANLGFDVNNDSFSLIGQNGSQSVVNVAHNGTNYHVTVNHLDNGNWMVSFVNQIY